MVQAEEQIWGQGWGEQVALWQGNERVQQFQKILGESKKQVAFDKREKGKRKARGLVWP